MHKEDQALRKLTYGKFTKSSFKYNKFYTNKFSSTLMSVGKPTEGKLGLVREKSGGREVGIIAIAYPTSLSP